MHYKWGANVLFQITDYLQKLQIPMMAAYGIYVGWVGDFGWRIESVDGWMARFETSLAGVFAYPSIIGLSVGVGLSWVIYKIWARYAPSTTPLDDQ